MMALKRTPIFPYHFKYARSLITFHGWEMPLSFSGIVSEHRTVRSSVGLFDVSHMSKLLVRGGEGVQRTLQNLVPSKIPLAEGETRYTHLLDTSGGVIDDVVISALGPGAWLCVCNAGASQKVLKWVKSILPEGSLKDLTNQLVCLAVQGPDSSDALSDLGMVNHQELERFEGAFDIFAEAHLGGVPPEGEGWPPLRWCLGLHDDGDPWEMYITRTGYTGEDGFEIFAPNGLGWVVWATLAERGVIPAGLGARDTLRLEKGYLLSGQDFDGSQTSLEMGYSWLIDWGHEFIGREALLMQKENGVLRRFRGLMLKEKGVPRPGNLVQREGRTVGRLTSATLSPSLGVGIGLGYMDPAVRYGDLLIIDIRGRRVEAEAVRLPFL